MSDTNAVKTNVTVKPDINEALLLVTGMAPGRPYPVRVLAVNEMGHGPAAFSDLALDESMLLAAYDSPMMSYHNSVVGYTWLIALLGCLAFVLILISGVMMYYRKRHSNLFGQKFHVNGYQTTNSGHGDQEHYPGQSPNQPQVTHPHTLWIDRRWNTGDYEKDSNSSEKKLLGTLSCSQQQNKICGNASENEYAYIDGHKLSTFNQGLTNRQNSPEPYATTDILRQQTERQIYAGNSSVVSLIILPYYCQFSTICSTFINPSVRLVKLTYHLLW